MNAVNTEDLSALFSRLGFGEVPSVWYDIQTKSRWHYVSYLEHKYLRKACESVGLETTVANAICDVADIIHGDPDLTRLFGLWHELLLSTPDRVETALKQWPFSVYPALEKPNACLFPVIALLSVLPQTLDLHRSLNIPDEITRDTLCDISVKIKAFSRTHGFPGINGFIIFNWLWHIFFCRTFKLGRLQFQPGTFCSPFMAYRNQRSGQVVLLAESGLRFGNDGRRVASEAPGWTSSFDNTGDLIQANPVCPSGLAIKHPVSLSAEDWTRVLAKGDPVLGIHIPKGGPMDHRSCGESLRRALSFFPKYFPDKPFYGFTCSSWLLDPQLERILPPDSNIVNFMAEFYQIPILAEGTGVSNNLCKIIFGRDIADWSEAPRNTTLQRALADHVLAGGRLCGGNGFILSDDLAWGNRIYRRKDIIRNLMECKTND